MSVADPHRRRPPAATARAGATSAAFAAFAAFAVAAAVAGCLGAGGSTTLPPAGANNDDGAGQLARASVQIRLGDERSDLEVDRAPAESPRRYSRRSPSPGDWADGSGYGGGDPTFAGSVYGLDSSVGGASYGGFGLVGGGGFGIGGPPLPRRTDGGDGAVLGVVTWRGDRGVAWPAGCPGARVAHAGGATAGAVVYLASAPLRRDRSDDDRTVVERGAIEADRCGLWPAAQVIGPLPGLVDVENGSDQLVRLGTGGRDELTLEPGGRWRVAVSDASLVRIDADQRSPAWLLGLTHDYHTVTDDLGRFVLDGVPAGTYDLVVWSPPLVRGLAGDQPVWTEPTTVRRRITVGATGTVRLSIALDPAP